MSNILFKTFQVCLVWALVGAGSVTAYHYLKPYIDKKTPIVSKQAEKIKKSAERLTKKMEVKKLINKMLPDAENIKPERKQEISQPPVVVKKPEPAKFQGSANSRKPKSVKSQKIAASDTEDDADLFNRQVAIVNDLMQ